MGKTLRILVAGQSNIDQWFVHNGGAAAEAFAQRLIERSANIEAVELFDAARGGSAILKASAANRAERVTDDGTGAVKKRFEDNHWFDETTGGDGVLLADFLEGIEADVAANGAFDLILWAQGEADVALVNEDNAATYAGGLKHVLDRLQEVSGAESIHIQALGDRSVFSERLHGGVDDIRAVQEELAALNKDMEIATAIYDLELRDTVHLTGEGYIEAAERLADAVATGDGAVQAVEVFSVADFIVVAFDLPDG